MSFCYVRAALVWCRIFRSTGHGFYAVLWEVRIGGETWKRQAPSAFTSVPNEFVEELGKSELELSARHVFTILRLVPDADGLSGTENS